MKIKLPSTGQRTYTGAILVAFFTALATAANLAGAQPWIASTAPISTWQAIAASADGTKLVAVAATQYLPNNADCAIPPPLIYISTDAGATWTPTSAPQNAWTAVASSADGTMLVAAAGVGGWPVSGDGQIYTSTNSGATWTASGAPVQDWLAVASSADGTRLVAATASDTGVAPTGLIYVSSDAGATWTPTSAPNNVWNGVASSADGTKLAAAGTVYSVVSPGHFFAPGGIYTSSDAGVTWTPTSASGGYWSCIASSADGTRLVAVDYYRVYTSSDFGQTWVQTSAGTNFNYNSWISVASSADGTRLVATARGPAGVCISTDSGATWTNSTSTPSLFEYWNWGAVATSADGYRVVAAGGYGIPCGGYICALPYSGPWRMANAPSNSWGAVAASADGTRLIAAGNGWSSGWGDSLIYTSTNSGASWVPTTAPSNSWTSVASSWDGTRLAAAGNYYPSGDGLIYISTNSGANWTPTTAPSAQWRAVASTAEGTRLVAAVGQKIYSSTNSGATWQPTSAPATNWQSLASSADGMKLAAGTSGLHLSNQWASAAGGIWLSTNGGATWVESTAGPDSWISLASSANGNILAASASSGQLHVSTNAGASWVAATDSTNFWQSVSCSADGIRMAAIGESSSSSGIVLLSTNSGANWFSAGAPADGEDQGSYYQLAVAVSANGSNIVAVGPDIIFTLHSPAPAPPPPPSPRLSIAVSGANLNLSWLVPSVPFVLQQSSDLRSSNWVDISLASPPTLNLTNLHYELTLPHPAGANSQFYRLRRRRRPWRFNTLSGPSAVWPCCAPTGGWRTAFGTSAISISRLSIKPWLDWDWNHERSTIT
jgi:hypothetical protein